VPAAGNISDRDCYTYVEFADANFNGELTPAEFVVLVNLLANQEVATSFERLPDILRAKFIDLSSEENGAFIVVDYGRTRRSNIFENDALVTATRSTAPLSLCGDTNQLVVSILGVGSAVSHRSLILPSNLLRTSYRPVKML